METNLIARFKSARSKAVPIVGIATPDPRATMRNIMQTTNGAAVLLWDCAAGLQGVNAAGRDVVNAVSGEMSPEMLTNAAELLTMAVKFPAKSILFCSNFDRFISNEFVAQAVWNLRDLYK